MVLSPVAASRRAVEGFWDGSSALDGFSAVRDAGRVADQPRLSWAGGPGRRFESTLPSPGAGHSFREGVSDWR